MMKVRILCFFFVGVMSAGVCNAAPPNSNSNEQEVRAFLQRASSKMFDTNDKIKQTLLEISEGKSIESLIIDPLKKLISAVKQYAEIFNESKQFDIIKLSDPELKYIFKIIQNSPHEIMPDEEKFKEMMIFVIVSTVLEHANIVPAYRNESIHLSISPDIQDIFAKNNDPEELKYYWTTWREWIGVSASKGFLKLIKTLKELAKMIDITPLESWLREYNISEMENVMKQIEPLYLQLHGFIRKQLHNKYGESVIKSGGPIPHHLFEQVLAQVWTSGSIIDDMYPIKDLSPYDAILKQNNYDALKMFKAADRFYQSLGFNPIPTEYWESNFKMISDDNKDNCKSEVYEFSTYVMMRYCQKMDFREFLKAHGYMTDIYYAREKIDLPAYYYDSHDLEQPVGEAVGLSASTPKHFNSIGLVTELKLDEEVKMNRLLRMGIDTLLNVPVHFVHTKVMADLFARSVDIAHLNKHYWKLMDKYVGVAPPLDRGSEAYDFSVKFYIDLRDNVEPKNFMTKVLGYQFYEKLCEISGQYSRSIKSEPINNCNFYGNKKAGDALKKMMRLGSSKPMREVLATILPEDPTVNADSLIEYYTPMKSWLVKKNAEENVVVGWTRSDKKVSTVTIPKDEDKNNIQHCSNSTSLASLFYETQLCYRNLGQKTFQL